MKSRQYHSIRIPDICVIVCAQALSWFLISFILITTSNIFACPVCFSPRARETSIDQKQPISESSATSQSTESLRETHNHATRTPSKSQNPTLESQSTEDNS